MDKLRNLNEDRNLLLSAFDQVKELSEKAIQDRLLAALSQYFHVETEVESVDRKSRIDMILVHKSDLSKSFPLGIEVKKAAKKKGVEIGDWLQQANRYNNAIFKDYGSILPFVFPQISGLYLDEGAMMTKHVLSNNSTLGPQHNASTLLSRFGIGELQLYQWRKTSKRDFIWQMRLAYAGSVIWLQHCDQFRSANIKGLSRAA